jgi:hypothetical protein
MSDIVGVFDTMYLCLIERVQSLERRRKALYLPFWSKHGEIIAGKLS